MLALVLPRSDYADDQKNSGLILYTHVAHKGAEVGCVLGALAGVFLHWRLSRSGSTSSIHSTVVGQVNKVGLLGLGLGTLAGLAMTRHRMSTRQTPIEWQDRAWRLQRHPTQNVIDAGADVGLAVGVLVGQPVLGVLGGLVGGFATSRLFPTNTNK